jgi:hypothetical protein
MNAKRTRLLTRVPAVLVFGAAALAAPATSGTDAAEVACAWITSFGRQPKRLVVGSCPR